jgi:hypothetical protein
MQHFDAAHKDNVYVRVLIQIFLGNTVYIDMQDSGHQDYQISLVSLQMYTDPLCQIGNNSGSARLLFIH